VVVHPISGQGSLNLAVRLLSAVVLPLAGFLIGPMTGACWSPVAARARVAADAERP